MYDSDPMKLYTYALEQLGLKKILFVEMEESDAWASFGFKFDMDDQVKEWYQEGFNLAKCFKKHFTGILVGNGGYTKETGDKLIREGYADMVTYGRLFIPNPDLVERFQNGWTLNEPNEKLLYLPGPKGYIDFPFYKE